MQGLAASTPIGKLQEVSRAGSRNELDAATTKRAAAYKDKNAPKWTRFCGQRTASLPKDEPLPRNIHGKAERRSAIPGQLGELNLLIGKDFAAVSKNPAPLCHRTGSSRMANPARSQQSGSITPSLSARLPESSLAIRHRSGSGLVAGSTGLHQPDKSKLQDLSTHLPEKFSASRHKAGSGLIADPVSIQRHQPTPPSGAKLTVHVSGARLSQRPGASRHMSGSGLVAGQARLRPPTQRLSGGFPSRRSGLEDTNIPKDVSRRGKRSVEPNSQLLHGHIGSYRRAADNIPPPHGNLRSTTSPSRLSATHVAPTGIGIPQSNGHASSPGGTSDPILKGAGSSQNSSLIVPEGKTREGGWGIMPLQHRRTWKKRKYISDSDSSDAGASAKPPVRD